MNTKKMNAVTQTNASHYAHAEKIHTPAYEYKQFDSNNSF